MIGKKYISKIKNIMSENSLESLIEKLTKIDEMIDQNRKKSDSFDERLSKIDERLTKMKKKIDSSDKRTRMEKKIDSSVAN